VSNEKYPLLGGLDMRVLRTVVALAAAVVATNITTASAQAQLSGCGNHSVAIMVEPALVASVRSGLDQFENDLCASGFNTVEHSSGFANPPSLRAYLGELYGQQGRNLAGAILIGDIPHAYQWVTAHSSNPSIPSTSEEAISFQYYADLNGTFAKSAAYASPGGHEYSYDLHGGDVGWEIWIGVLPRYKGDLQQTTAAINRYFAKNHAYRSRQLQRPSVFLEINEHFHATTLTEHDELMAFMRSGPYSWTPYSNAAGARLYFDSPPGGLSVQQGYTDMQDGVADFTVTDTHGYWGASGQLTIATVETMPVKTLFFWSNGCAVGDLDHTDNFLASMLYSPTSDVVVAKGTTNDSGGMGNNSNGFFGHNIASALASGAVFGDAVRSHVNVPLIWPWSLSREFHFGTVVILGDPTLRRMTTYSVFAANGLLNLARSDVTGGLIGTANGKNIQGGNGPTGGAGATADGDFLVRGGGNYMTSGNVIANGNVILRGGGANCGNIGTVQVYAGGTITDPNNCIPLANEFPNQFPLPYVPPVLPAGICDFTGLPTMGVTNGGVVEPGSYNRLNLAESPNDLTLTSGVYKVRRFGGADNGRKIKIDLSVADGAIGNNIIICSLERLNLYRNIDVKLIGGGTAANVYWEIAGSGDSGLGGGGVFVGTMYATNAAANIRFHLNNATVTGALYSGGAVSFGNSTTVNFVPHTVPGAPAFP